MKKKADREAELLETLQQTLASYEHTNLLNTQMLNKLNIFRIALEEIEGRLSVHGADDVEKVLDICRRALYNKVVDEWQM